MVSDWRKAEKEASGYKTTSTDVKKNTMGTKYTDVENAKAEQKPQYTY